MKWNEFVIQASIMLTNSFNEKNFIQYKVVLAPVFSSGGLHDTCLDEKTTTKHLLIFPAGVHIVISEI